MDYAQEWTIGRSTPVGEKLGVYVRKGDKWHLENVTNRATAELAQGLNEALGLETLITGPWTHFPEWLES